MWVLYQTERDRYVNFYRKTCISAEMSLSTPWGVAVFHHHLCKWHLFEEQLICFHLNIISVIFFHYCTGQDKFCLKNYVFCLKNDVWPPGVPNCGLTPIWNCIFLKVLITGFNLSLTFVGFILDCEGQIGEILPKNAYFGKNVNFDPLGCCRIDLYPIATIFILKDN